MSFSVFSVFVGGGIKRKEEGKGGHMEMEEVFIIYFSCQKTKKRRWKEEVF